MKKLYRSTDDKIIAGIFGGLGDYLDVDPNLLRLIGLLIFAFTAFIPFLIIYFIAIIIIPSERDKEEVEVEVDEE